MKVDGKRSVRSRAIRGSRRLERVVALSPAVIYSCDPGRDFAIRYMSPNVRERLGHDASEFLGDPGLWMSGLHPDDRDRVLAELEGGLAKDGISMEYRFRHKEGTWRWMRDEARVIRDPAGTPVEVVGYWIDVTGRRETEQRLQAILDHAPVLMFAKDLEGRYLFVNGQTELACGLTRERFIGRTAAELFSPDVAQAVREQDMKALQMNAPLQTEVTLALPPGTRTFSVVKFPVRDAAHQPCGVCGIATDITERKALEEQFRQAQKMEAVGRLAGGVAHDFNNLLTVINGYSRMAMESLNERDPLHEYLREVATAGDRAASLTRQLLAFSRKQVLRRRPLDLNAVVSGMEKMVRRLIGEDVVLSIAPGRDPGPVLADPGQVEQILLNLAVNARDAMPRGGTLTIETAGVVLDGEYARKHTGVVPGPYVMLAISDTGIGMTSEIQKHLFEPFFTTKPQGKGTGLGLSTVYGIVKQSGGHIMVYSEVGEGSCFKILFPRMEAADPAADPGAATPPAGGKETILLVEDQAEVRQYVAKVLRSNGYHVLEASDGQDALQVAEVYSEPIHLVLTDVVMPLIGGPTLAIRLSAVRKGTKFLFMSGYTEGGALQQAIMEKGTEYLQKPFTSPDLLRKVREILDAT